MQKRKLLISGIPSILWGIPSERVYIHVHGKMSRKEYAESFARIAQDKGWQTLGSTCPDTANGKACPTAATCGTACAT